MILMLRIILALCLAANWRQVTAFVFGGDESRAHRSTSSALHLGKSSHNSSRRKFLLRQMILATPSIVGTTTTAGPGRSAEAAALLLMDKSSPDIPPFSGDASAAKERFRRAIGDVDDLITNYDEITRSGGDNVRLYLGTQGVKSNMYGILKVLSGLREEANDVVEFSEAMNEFEAYLFQADGSAYQSLFAEFSSAKIAPGSLLRMAREDIVNMRKFMGDLAVQLSLEI
ncbi:hypothetical protein ACHAXA_000660 [Cyclostephanos tholiformis]|uniref:Uncharacterized protein n=1 Tax=Cyclostephanos tholiformis TaxID=382380 RepID=A0ABD3SCW3_9STRA